MRKVRSYAFREGSVRLSVTVHEDDSPVVHDYGLSRPVWVRACAILRRHGFDGALALMDAKAERAFDRGDIDMCVRWRDLMAAVHAIGSDEPLLSDRVH